MIFCFGNLTYPFQLEENGMRVQCIIHIMARDAASGMARRETYSVEASMKREPEQMASGRTYRENRLRSRA